MDKNRRRRTLAFEFNNSDFKKVVGTIVAFNELYHKLSDGDNLLIGSFKSLSSIVEDDSEFEQHSGTEFANTRVVTTESPTTPYIPRTDVYETIETYARPDARDSIIEDLDRKYPISIFGDEVPVEGAFKLLINTYIGYLSFPENI